MIAFAAPWALAGLLAAAIPILLHLFARREPPTVDFPAVRYLSDTARSHQHRLTLQHWLLLLARTLLIAILVLAAAGPSWPKTTGGGHVPTALVLVVDNSLSSGVTTGGTPMIELLRRAAAGVISRATPDDALWLLTADGVARRGQRGELRATVESLAPLPRRLDLGRAIGLAREVIADQGGPGEVLVLTDLQATALSPAAGSSPLIVARPTGPVAVNAGVASIAVGAEPWTRGGGRVTIGIAGGDTAGVPMSVTLGTRPPRQALGAPSQATSLSLPATATGWVPLTVELAPDELRLDDRWTTAVRIAPPARVRWDAADRYVAAACEVLREGRRLEPGTEVWLGSLGPGPSIVVPPADPAQVGALNRALAARGVPWRYGQRLTVPATTDSAAILDRVVVTIRQVLESADGSGQTGVLVRAGGAPWLVQSGDVVLLGSRFDPAWTMLPVSAGFVPLLDALVNRYARGTLATLPTAPGDPVALPDQADALMLEGRAIPVEGGSMFRPADAGVHYVLAGRDTIGVVSVNPDPRESDLTRASDAMAMSLWRGARLVSLDEAIGAAFTTVARGDLRGLFLWLALALGLVEMALAGRRRRSA